MHPSPLVLLAVLGVSLGILALGLRRRVLLRIGVRNIARRKTQVALVVSGLLIGTAILTSSLVIEDTFDATITRAVLRGLGEVDEIVWNRTSTGELLVFPAWVHDDLAANRSDMPNVDGLAPRLLVQGSLLDNDTDLAHPSVNVVGFDPALDFGEFVLADGSTTRGESLAAGEGIVNEDLAGDLEVAAGHRLSLYVRGRPLYLTVAEVVRDEGRGAWRNGPALFLRLDALQAGLGLPGRLNAILVSNLGGVEDGADATDAALADLERHLGPARALGLDVDPVKRDAIEDSTRNADMLAQLFTLLGTFTIIAGVILIVNIFVMLAEERKGEMGVSRALGMRRSHLVQSFVYEGLVYALISSALGALAGLLVAAGILWSFGQVFASGELAFEIAVDPLALLLGFAAGFLITIAAIVGASWRVSKLNIVRAIRDIPEPVSRRSTGLQVGLGLALAAAGVLGTVYGYVTRTPVLHPLGPSTLALGLAIALMRIVRPRVAFTGAGAFILFWILEPYRLYEPEGADIDLFIVAGLLLVLGGVLVVLFNGSALLRGLLAVTRGRTLRPVLTIAISYPTNKRFRTGTTLAMIALIMFTIATMTEIQGLVAASVETSIGRESGGYDLVGFTNSGTPKPNWTADLEASPAFADLSGWNGLSQARTIARTNASAPLSEGVPYGVLGADDGFLAAGPFEFYQIAPGYPDAGAVWDAVRTRRDVAVVDNNVVPQTFGPSFGTLRIRAGDSVYLLNATGGILELTVIGILYERFVEGFFVHEDLVAGEFGVDYPSVFYFDVRDGADATAVGHRLERDLLPYELVTFNVAEFIRGVLETTLAVMNLLQAYLALGLIVGIAGLGVITLRNVVERKGETGALRAIGFRRSMVLRAFLIEISFVAALGVLLGILLGIALSYDIYLDFFEGSAPWVLPWERHLAFAGIAFGASLLATASPAIKASRMPPAEALRRVE